MRKKDKVFYSYEGLVVKITIVFSLILFLSVSQPVFLHSQQTTEPNSNIENLPGYPQDEGYDVEIIGLDNPTANIQYLEPPSMSGALPAANVEEMEPSQEVTLPAENLEATPAMYLEPPSMSGALPTANVEEMELSQEVTLPAENLEAAPTPSAATTNVETLTEAALTTGALENIEAQPAKPQEQAAVAAPSAPETAEAVEPVAPVVAKVSLDFKEADVRNVLRILSYKSGVNIVASPEVAGVVTIRLTDVPWDKALDVILNTYGYGYERKDNIISVYPMAMLTARKQEQADLAAVQPTVSKVIQLKFIDASDMRRAIEPQLSPRGKITILETTGQAGWEFGGAELGKRKRVSTEKVSKSKMFIISDIPPVLEKLEEIIAKLDKRPQQVLIETRILEVNRDKLKDVGLEFGTGADGNSFIEASSKGRGSPPGPETQMKIKSQMLQVAPATFSPKVSLGGTVGTFAGGLTAYFQKITGSQFQAILHALEEDVQTNTLSAPRILTLSDQEATILVGTKYPILTSEISTESASTVTTTLDYYQDIGIQLNVVPQVNDDGYINLIVHPAVTSYTTTVGTNAYPVIDTRETQTQILIKDGETVVIGGLLKDVKGDSIVSVPFLGKIPILGFLFNRKVVDIQKIDLLVFITATIVKTDEDLITLKESIESPLRSVNPEQSNKEKK